MWRAVTRLVSPGGRGARLSTLMFHRVLARKDPLVPDLPDAGEFDRILDWVGAQFRVLPALEACERLDAGTLPGNAAVISFDDGYRDNHDVALPILLRHRMSAVFFIATGFLGGGIMFNDRVIEALRRAPADALDADWLGLGRLPLASNAQRITAIARLLPAVKHLGPHARLEAVARIEQACASRPPDDLMMDAAQVRALHDAGMQIGGHTRNHPILRVLDADSARREIEGGRDDLRAILGSAPELFAYPNGRLGDDFERTHRDMVEHAGFSRAFTTHPGAARADTDPYLLPRFTPWDRSAARFKARMVRNLLIAPEAGR